jgi:hypothetical protein
MIPLSATSGIAALRSRPKTESRQSRHRQILAPSVSSLEPIHIAGNAGAPEIVSMLLCLMICPLSKSEDVKDGD